VQEVQPTIEPAAADNEPDAEELKTAQSARKNRHPHQKTGFFNAIINALRSQGKNAAEQPAAQDESDDDGDASMGAGQGDSVVADTAAETPAASEIAKSDADTVQQSSISVSIAESCLDLQSVVEKFIECNRVPSITVRPRTMVRRYRD